MVCRERRFKLVTYQDENSKEYKQAQDMLARHLCKRGDSARFNFNLKIFNLKYQFEVHHHYIIMLHVYKYDTFHLESNLKF